MIQNIVEQIYWANTSVINWIKEEREESEEINKLMSHVLNAGRVWVWRANQKSSDRDTFKVHSITDMLSINESNYQGLKDPAHRDTNQEVSYNLFDGSPGKSSIEEMILHVFTHGFHHFGQMARISAGSGKRFPNLSYIGFARTK